MNFAPILTHAVFFGFLSAWLAERKRYGAVPWFALGVLLGVIAPFLLYLQPDRAMAEHAPVHPSR